jgi:bloom syndrome protein
MNKSIDIEKNIENNINSVLKKYFGFNSLKPFQQKIVTKYFDDSDILVLSPTGSGKSLCYQLPAVMSKGVTVIVSPLKSLIEDQISQLKNKNISVAFLNEDVSKKDKAHLLKKISNIPEDDYLLFYVTPEVLMEDKLILLLKDLHEKNLFPRLVIDEAHCVSTWGHDFRDSYLKIKLIKKYIIDLRITAVTATATPIVKEDIINLLELVNPYVETTGFFRNNLNLKIINRNDTILATLRDLIQNKYLDQSGVIYCHSRRETERVSTYLENYFKVSYYHAGLDQNIRKFIQKKWIAGQTKIIVATIAFGMGIDKPDVRFVIHYNLPSSIEGYYQEIGRAGRDGKPADCILYYSYQDRVFYDNMFKKNKDETNANANNAYVQYGVSMTNFDNVEFLDIDKSEIRDNYINYQTNKLNDVVDFIENMIDCRHVQLSSYFGEITKYTTCNGMCDNCSKNKNLEEKDMTHIVQKLLDIINNKTDITNTITKNELRDIYQKDPQNPLLSYLSITRLINKMLQKDIIREKIIKQDSGFWCSVLWINPNTNTNIDNIILSVDNPKFSLMDFVVSEQSNKDTEIDTQNETKTAKTYTKTDTKTDTKTEIKTNSFVNQLMDDSLQEKYNLTHLPLYNILINYRNQEAKRLKCAPYRVLANNTLEEIVRKNPTSEAELKNIVGIGEAKYRDFGKDIIKMIKSLQ